MGDAGAEVRDEQGKQCAGDGEQPPIEIGGGGAFNFGVGAGSGWF